MRNRTRSTAALAAVTLAAGAGVAALAAPANAAQSTMPLACDGQQLTVRVNTNHSSQNGGWGVGQVVAGGTGHLVPTSFSGSLVDNAVNQTLFTFEQAKGGGNANHNQPTVTCTESETVPTSITPLIGSVAPTRNSTLSRTTVLKPDAVILTR